MNLPPFGQLILSKTRHETKYPHELPIPIALRPPVRFGFKLSRPRDSQNNENHIPTSQSVIFYNKLGTNLQETTPEQDHCSSSNVMELRLSCNTYESLVVYELHLKENSLFP